MRTGFIVGVFCLVTLQAANSKDVAICGQGAGYVYSAGEWAPDATYFKLSQLGDEFAFHLTDETGDEADEGEVLHVKQTDNTLTIVVDHGPVVIETISFIKSPSRNEAIWSNNRPGKIGVFRATCSLLDF